MLVIVFKYVQLLAYNMWILICLFKEESKTFDEIVHKVLSHSSDRKFMFLWAVFFRNLSKWVGLESDQKLVELLIQIFSF